MSKEGELHCETSENQTACLRRSTRRKFGTIKVGKFRTQIFNVVKMN